MSNSNCIKHNCSLLTIQKFVSSTLEQKEIAISPTTNKPTHSFGGQ